VLGCRSRGAAAARAYQAHPRTEVVGLCDLVRERLDALGDELEVKERFTDLLQHRFPKMDTAAYGFELYGTEGRLFWKRGGAWFLPAPHFVPDGERDRWEPLEPVTPESWEPGMHASLDDYCFADEYVRALDEGRDHECSGAEAVHVMEVMMAVFESAAYGRRVDLPQARRDHPLLRWRAERGPPPLEGWPRDYGEWLTAEDRRLGRTEGCGRY